MIKVEKAQVGDLTFILHTMKNKKGTKLTTINYGAAMLRWEIEMEDGSFRDVLLGFADLEEYPSNSFCFGAMVGRSANRIGGGWYYNKDEVAASGEETETVKEAIQLSQNEGANHLHGGFAGFQYKLWDATIGEDGKSVIYTYFSEDGEEGYPGNLEVKVTYRLREDDAVQIDMEAHTDATTLVNLTNHAYFNLDGKGNILKHEAKFESDEIAVVDENNVPTGELQAVAGTAWDFREWNGVGTQMEKEPEKFHMGYDSHFVVPEEAPFTMRKQAQVRNEDLVLEMSSDLPGFQCYSAGYLTDEVKGKNGKYEKFGGICLEAQFCPNAVNIASDNPAFAKPFLSPEATYHHVIEYRITHRKEPKTSDMDGMPEV